MKSQIILCLTSVLILVSSNINFAQSPNWLWAKSAGSVSIEYSNATCVDANGNVYITGTFQGTTLTLGTYTLHNKNAGTLDIFVAKYDANGNVLWAKSGGGIGYDFSYGICTDTNDNVYIEGYFDSPSITFDTITLNDSSSQDVFIVKYDSLGNVKWAKNGINKKGESSTGWGICSDAERNVYIFGSSDANIIFDRDTLSQGTFIVKYDGDGNVRWAKEIASGLSNNSTSQSICTDIGGNIYITGTYENKAIFGNDTFSTGFFDVFIAKYDSNGNFLWAKSPSGQAVGVGISADANGNIYLIGYFGSYLVFGNDTLTALEFSNFTIFIAKYDSSGNALWGRSPGGTVSDYGQSICTDTHGNVYFTGYFTSPYLNFGGIPVINNNAGTNTFITKYDANGNALFAQSIGDGSDYGMGVCADKNGNVYLTGYFGNYTLNFGSTTLFNNGSYDIFLAKASTIVGINEMHGKDGSLLVYPNPTTGIVYIATNKNIKNGQITFYNSLGEVVYRDIYEGELKTIDIELKEGIYFLRLTSESETLTMKVVKQ